MKREREQNELTQRTRKNKEKKANILNQETRLLPDLIDFGSSFSNDTSDEVIWNRQLGRGGWSAAATCQGR